MSNSPKLACNDVEPDTLLSHPGGPLYGHVVSGVATTNCSRAETRRATFSLPLRTELVVSHQHCCRSETMLRTRKSHTVLGTSRSYHFDICVWRKVETVVHCHSQELGVQVSQAWKELSDEVGILKRPAGLMTSIRVALMGKRSSWPAPVSQSCQPAELHSTRLWRQIPDCSRR